MNNQTSRITVISKRFAIAALAIAFFSTSALAQKKAKTYPLIPSINAYSFSDLLSARDTRDKQQLFTLFNLLDWCKANHVTGLDPTAYFFPTYPEVP